MTKKKIKQFVKDGIITKEHGEVLFHRLIDGDSLDEVSKEMDMKTTKVKTLQEEALKSIEIVTK